MLRYVLGISYITVVLIAIRHFSMGKISKRLQYALWLLIPAFMLIAPVFSIEVNVPAVTPIVTEQVIPEETIADYLLSEEVATPLNSESDFVDEEPAEVSESLPTRSINWPMTIRNIVAFVAAMFMLFVALYNIGFAIYCRRKRSFVEIDPISNLKVYTIDHSSAPFLLGNEIYLSEAVSDKDMAKYAVCHEYCHYKHLDPIWNLLRFITLALNWYNPLIWYAFILVEQDCELACDEAVLKFVGEDKNIEYGKVLLTLLSDKSLGKRDFYLSTAMNGRSKTFMKNRISNIKAPIKYRLLPVVLVLAIALFSVGCSLIEYNEESKDTPDASEHLENLESIESEIDEVAPTETSATESIPSETLYLDEYPQFVPEIGELQDGYYTVGMKSVYAPTEDGRETATFLPWIQVEVTSDYIDNLKVGDIIDLSGTNCDPNFMNLEVEILDYAEGDSFHILGSMYSGKALWVNDSYGLGFYEVEGTDTWKAFSFSMAPIYRYTDWTRLPLSEDYVIFDGVTLAYFETELYESLTDEERRAYIEFTDTTYSEDVVDRISNFFEFAGDTRGLHTYWGTVIHVENNEVTEVYFWYKS